MDLNQIKLVDEPMVMHLKDADGEIMEDPENGSTINFYVYSSDSNAFKLVDTAINQRKMRKAAKKKDIKAIFESTPEEDEKDRVERIAACIHSWENVKEGGVELPFSKKDAIRLVSEYPIIADQIQSFADNRANFIKK